MDVLDWKGREVSSSVSQSGVHLLADYSDNMIRDEIVPWPPPPIVQKLCQGQAQIRLVEEVRADVTRVLGHYSNLQSIHSEDAITYSYFGSLMNRDPGKRASFLNWVVSRLGLDCHDNTTCSIDLWRRIPHPEKPTAFGGGPEIDVILDGDRCVVHAEAKWTSGQGKKQGVNKNRTQMHLRRDFFRRYGLRIYGPRKFLVLGIIRDEPFEQPQAPDEESVITRTVKWSELAEYHDHPRAEEFGRYYGWKAKNSKR
jgi:hypothetical protein